LQASGSPALGRTFGCVAEAYARTRPPYPPAAIERAAAELGLGPDAAVLDLGAGTGNLTRALRLHFGRVVAVEPDPAMRAFFDGEVLAGTAEAIPLPDGAVDGVFAGEAFHWFDGAPALAEIRRVARGLAILMRSWGDTEQEGLVPRAFRADLDVVWQRFHGARARDDWDDWRALVQPDGEVRFEQTVQMSGRDLVDLHLTSSTCATIPDDERAAIAERAYPLMEPVYDLRVVTFLVWKRL
jgi:SAM-dependent methyltransferase